MFFNHKAAAVDGVGFGHKVLAVLGLRWFDVEIIIPPPGLIGGGGGSGRPTTVWEPDQKYEIIVRIKHKDKVWEERRMISGLMMKSLEKVVSWFIKVRESSKINLIVDYVSAKARQVMVRIINK